MNQVLVTGARGFVGRHLCVHLERSGYRPRRASRGPAPAGAGDWVSVGALNGATDWRPAVAGVDTVVHLAARVHVLKESAAGAGRRYREANVDASLALARAAAAAGVRRLVYVSSIKVNGEQTVDRPFRPEDPPRPRGAYAVSKWRAEQGLREFGERSGLEIVVVRPPLVYGPGVGGNFRRLLALVDRGWPLPLGFEHNRRSMISVFNLADLLLRCCEVERAPAQPLLVSDGEDVSTAELIRRLGRFLGRPARLWSAPAARLLGRLGPGAVRRLAGSLQLDPGSSFRSLDWRPLTSMADALAATASAYRREISNARREVAHG